MVIRDLRPVRGTPRPDLREKLKSWFSASDDQSKMFPSLHCSEAARQEKQSSSGEVLCGAFAYCTDGTYSWMAGTPLRGMKTLLRYRQPFHGNRSGKLNAPSSSGDF